MLAAPTRPLLGSTVPRVFTGPLVRGRPGPCGCGCALTPETSLGFAAVQFSEVVLGIRLIPWQRWLLIHAMELRPNGGFRFRTVLVLVARQNGKTTLVLIKNLFKMFVLGVPLVIGTAQNLDIAEESWDKAVEFVESIPDLARELPKDGGVVRVNGKKTLKLDSGSRWKVAAASRRGGRGLSGDDVNLDELREHHTWEAWAAVTKTTMARPDPQVWAYSNAGDDRSVVLNDLQAKGTEAAEDPDYDGALGLFEWSAPPGCRTDDEEMWPWPNPSLGYPQGIPIEALRAAHATDPEPIFRTECLCQAVPDLAPPKVPEPIWLACRDVTSQIAGPVILTWEVSWHRSHAAIGVAGYRADGLPHLELIEYRAGTRWVAKRLAEIVRRQPVTAVVFDPSGPAGSLLTEVDDALPVRLEPQPMTARDNANACGLLHDLAHARQLRHLGDPRVAAALKISATRELTGAWAWDLRTDAGDMIPIKALTNVLGGLTKIKPPAPAPAPQNIETTAHFSETNMLATAGF
jgi:hypothetical protein